MLQVAVNFFEGHVKEIRITGANEDVWSTLGGYDELKSQQAQLRSRMEVVAIQKLIEEGKATKHGEI